MLMLKENIQVDEVKRQNDPFSIANELSKTLIDVNSKEDLVLIKPMVQDLLKMIDEMDCEDEDLHLRREISLVLHCKNEDISSKIREDLQELSHNELFEFNIFNELKHKIQEQREKTFILIYTVSNIVDIEEIGEDILNSNLTAILIGPDDDDLILCAGKYNVASYVPMSKYTKEGIEQKILDNFQRITKNTKSQSFLSLFVGTTGGTGTTTISTNLANVLSMTNPLKNVLYLDLSTTKAISNIFFSLPAPKRTIVDFLNIHDYSEESMLNSGLYQIKNNLYIIPGIQSHMDREEIVKEENERKIINLIYQLKNLFDFVIIDGGLAKDSELQIAIEEISDQIFIVTELTTIHISILQTYYELMKKAGWKDKVKIIINREDSQNAISMKDASEILNSKKSKDISFDIHIPNGGNDIRECWNFGKLITSEYPNAKFSKAIKKSQFYSDLEIDLSTKMQKPTLMQKIFGKK
jgi:cellulose biosynthesis protein BcsQ